MRINKSDAFREALIAIIRSDVADSDPEFNDAVIDVLVHELSTALSVEEYKEAEKADKNAETAEGTRKFWGVSNG